MSAVTNRQLFSHAFLAQLQNDPANDEAAAPIAQGLRDWLPSRDGSTFRSLLDSWVGPVLDFLDLHHAPANDAPHIHLLYAHHTDETPVGLCYVVPPGQDGSTGSPRGLNDTLEGRHPLAQAVLALRARRLRWGMLTDGTRWRLVDAESLYRYEHYLEVNVDELARSAEYVHMFCDGLAHVAAHRIQVPEPVWKIRGVHQKQSTHDGAQVVYRRGVTLVVQSPEPGVIVYLIETGADPREADVQRERVEDRYELGVKRSPNVRLVSQRADGVYGQVLTLSFVNEDAKYEVQPVTQQALLVREFKFVFPEDREALVVTIRSLLESAVARGLVDEAGVKELLEGLVEELGTSEI